MKGKLRYAYEGTYLRSKELSTREHGYCNAYSGGVPKTGTMSSCAFEG